MFVSGGIGIVKFFFLDRFIMVVYNCVFICLVILVIKVDFLILVLLIMFGMFFVFKMIGIVVNRVWYDNVIN